MSNDLVISRNVKTPTKVNMLEIVKSKHSNLFQQTLPYYDPRYAHHFPYFGYGKVELMMRDPRITYALGLIKGPIYNYTKFFSSEEAEDPAVNQAIIDLDYHFSYKVEADSSDTEEFVIKTLNSFWNDGVLKALRAIEWGYSPNQIRYKRSKRTGKIEYAGMITYQVQDTKPVSRKHDLIGIYLEEPKKFIAIPKAFIHVHQRETNQFTGRSRLTGCHIPWHEAWVLGGARDIRRNWFFRNSYDGGTMYVPQEMVEDESGNEIDSTEFAIKLLENKFTGGYMVLPKKEYEKSKQDRSWEYEPPKSNTTPDGLMEYPQELRIEILEGLGIPPEVVENSNSNGLGSATGRKIPLLAFYATLSPISIELITDVCRQIVDPLLQVNGMDEGYDLSRIIPKAFDPMSQDQMQQGNLTKTESNTDPGTPNPDRE